MPRGYFITFEGIDGSGKSTQMKNLQNFLADHQFETRTTREPGGTAVGNAIRNILLDNTYTELSMESEALLYAASRVQLIKQEIKPSIENGITVLCDRFVDSSVAYQSVDSALTISDIWDINRFALRELTPDLTFLIDIKPESSYKRLGNKRDRIEERGMEYQKVVRDRYLTLAEQDERIVVINGNNFQEEVFRQIVQSLKPLIFK